MAREPRKPPKRRRLKNITNQRKSKTILSIKKRNQAALISWENQHTHFLHPNQNQVNQLSSQIRPPRMILFSKVSDLRLSQKKVFGSTSLKIRKTNTKIRGAKSQSKKIMKKPGLKGIRSRKRNRQVRLRKKLLKIIMCKIRLRNLIKKKSKNMKKRLSKFMKKSLKYVKWNTIKSKFLNPKLRKQHRWQKMIKKKKS